MTRHDRREQALAICLSAVAGYVDAIAFIQLGGFFVSFMSGNSTRLAVGLIEEMVNAVIAAGLIAAFVLGVALGSLLGHGARTRRRPAVLVFVAALLAIAAGASMVGGTATAIAAMALAMGAENAVFEREGEVRIGLTYMTGSLVKLGQGIAGALLGRSRRGWIPYFLLWAGFVSGAVTGAAAWPRFGLAALWFAAAGALILGLLAMRTNTVGAAT